jgi:alanyl-tRNA synthetase
MVKKVILDLETARAEKKAARNAFFEREAELLCETEENFVLSFADATQDELRALANKAISKIGGILVLLSGNDGEYKYILASDNVDLKGEVKKINAALCGRGGGSSVMAQGSFTATLSEIEKYFT